MFRSLVVNKNNIKAYIIAILASFGTAQMGLAPFNIAMLGSLIEQKIPIIIPFVISLIVTYIKFGISAMIRLLVTIIIYALIKSIVKDKDSKYKNVLRLILSQLMASTFVILIGIEKYPNALLLILEAILNSVFMLAFSNGLFSLLNLSKDSKLKSEDTISTVLLLAMIFSGLSIYKLFGISVFSLFTVIFLMIVCWKKSIRFATAAALFMAILYSIVSGSGIIYLLLYLIVGISTALLSKAGRVGLAIGLIFTATYCLFFAPTKEKLYSNLGYNKYLMDDFKNYIKQSNNDLASGDISDELITDIDSAIEEMVNTPYSIIFREMLIGFAILLLIPSSILATLESITREEKYGFELFGSRRFGFYKIYLLNPGNEPEKSDSQIKLNDNQKDDTENEKGSKKKKTNKSKKNKKKS